MNLVEIGNLLAARRIASRATLSGTPSTSNRIFAGRMTATQDSTPPFPVPIRTSSGFFVKLLSGKIRIHTLPRRFMKRVMATRAASICFVSIQHLSSDWSPYSPNATLLPREAKPRRLPRCIFRYFTRAGIKAISLSPQNGYLFCATASCRATATAGETGAAFKSDRLTSPLQIQHLTPSFPYIVCASEKPKSIFARSVWRGTLPW